ELCCFEQDGAPDAQADPLSIEEYSTLYRQLDEMRRAFKAMVAARNPFESAIKPRVNPRLISRADPLPPERRPTWTGWTLTRETLAYPGREWSDERGAELQAKLYALVEAFGDYGAEEFDMDAETACDFENVCREHCDYLLMYYLMTPLEVKPGQQVVRRFLGNYYPRTVVNPNLDFVFRSLSALPAFYAWLARAGLIRWSVVDAVVEECRDWPWFRQRLLEYAELRGRARSRWCREFDYKAMPVG
ncbi:MAG TPA: hypothetical protein VI643_01180, partial [Planctomycetota bacterium]|nr:hypothetical protein [Planctomycetota bacterium]